MPTITKILLRRITGDLALKPLVHGEFRPITKMGGHYISLEPASGEGRPLFSLEINGVACHIYYLPTPRENSNN